MLRICFGLLLVGLTAAAHASEEKGGKVFTPESDQTATQLARSDAGVLFPYKQGKDSVVLNRTAVAATANAALSGSGTGSASDPFPFSQPENETAPATEAAHLRNYGGRNRFLTLARHKRIEFNGEQFKVTLRQDSALIEAGPLKVGLRSGSTSMIWSKAL
jgi:hypothetical protein